MECIESQEWDQVAVDPQEPEVGTAFFYLVRGNSYFWGPPGPPGPLGQDSDGEERIGTDCGWN